MSERTKALVVLSGGQDSTTCLYWAKKHFDEVAAITFDYGQRHAIELQAAKDAVGFAGVTKHIIVTVGAILFGSSPLVSNNELEQYEDMNELPGGLEKTFVPGRNMLFFTLAANYAYSIGFTNIVTGVCEEDFGGYPDCRNAFVLACEKAIQEGFGYDDSDQFRQFKIHAPLMFLTKAESIHMAISFPGCYEALAYSHTAYDGQYPPVGKDHASQLRAKGFLEAKLPDPLVLRAYYEELMPLPKTKNYLAAGYVQPAYYSTFNAFLFACMKGED